MKYLAAFILALLSLVLWSFSAGAQGAAAPGGKRLAPNIKIVDNTVTLENGIPYGFKEGLVRPETQRILTYLILSHDKALWAGESYLKEPCREIAVIVNLGEHAIDGVKLEVQYNGDGEATSVAAVAGEQRTDLPLHALMLQSEQQVRDKSYLPAQVGHVYAVRSYSMLGDEYLALVRVKGMEGRNITLEQRVVKRWDKSLVTKRWTKRRAEWAARHKSATSGSARLDFDKPGFNFYYGTWGDIAVSRGYFDITLWRNEAWQGGGGMALTPNIYRGRDSRIYTLPKDVTWESVSEKSAGTLAPAPHVSAVQKDQIYLIHVLHKGEALKWEYWAAIRVTNVGEQWYDFDWKMVKVVTKPPQKEKDWGEISFAPCYGLSWNTYKTNHSVIFRD